MTGQNQNCIWVGIGIDVSEETELNRVVVEMNNLLAEKYGASKDFTGSNHPHLNLYDLSVPIENLELIIEKVREISEINKGFEVEIGEVNYFPFGLFFLEISKNDALNKLHKRIVEELVKLKGKCIDEDYLAPYRKYSERQKEVLMQYGNPHVLDQFQPHITIGHVKNQQDKLDTICKELSKFAPMTKLKIESVHIVTDGEKDNRTLGKFDLILVGQ
jgi:2'-5' RNA ligase